MKVAWGKDHAKSVVFLGPYLCMLVVHAKGAKFYAEERRVCFGCSFEIEKSAKFLGRTQVWHTFEVCHTFLWVGQ